MIIKFKIFENENIKLNDVPIYRGYVKRKVKDEDFKYKINDIIFFKQLNRHFIIKDKNKNSDEQDYYLENPLNHTEYGWVAEEELSDPDTNSDNYNEVVVKQSSDKYNL